jgi:aryl-alcohol dehydrogenase-like predicted oxidoreductase
MIATTVRTDRSPDGVPHRALGCMRLSTERARDDDRAVAVLHAAFDAGITLLDTADAYGWDDGDAGHNERLIARAISTWNGDRSRLRVATKGGLTRPEGGWVPDGRRATWPPRATPAAVRSASIAFISTSCTRLIHVCPSRRACARSTP